MRDTELPRAIATALEALEAEKRAWSLDWTGGFAFSELSRDPGVWASAEEALAHFEVKVFARPAPRWREEVAESFFPAHGRGA